MKKALNTEIWLPDQDTHFANMKGGAASLLFYQQDRLVAAEKYLKGHEFAIDVGAHVGLLTRQLAICFGSVAAYEPNLPSFHCLNENTKNHLNVERYYMALGSSSGMVQMQTDGDNSGDAYVGEQSGPVAIRDIGSKLVPRTTIDVVIQNQGLPLRLLKIDVQGYEYEVLRGAEKTLRTHKPVIVVECEPGMPSQRFNTKDNMATDFLVSLGARLGKRINADYIYYWE